MKYVFSLILAGFISLGAVEQAHAKKFGSGGFGKAFQTSPFKKATPASPQKPMAAPNKAKSRPGMGGLMGGLLAGGMFAYLLGSGAFEGIQFMDIILFALIGFVLFKLFARPKAASQYAGMERAAFDQQPGQLSGMTPAQSGSSIPLQFPEGFDIHGFEQGALEHFALVHKAWDQNDFSTIEEYVAPTLLTGLKQQRNQYAATLENKILDLSAEIVRGEPIAGGHRLSILFRGVMKDMKSNEEHGVFDVWHLEKAASGAWLIVGIEAE